MAIQAELEDINALRKGRLRLGIPPMVGTQMAELIGDFRQRYPGIELEIAEFGGVTMQQAVLAGDLDLALTALTPSWPRCRSLATRCVQSCRGARPD